MHRISEAVLLEERSRDGAEDELLQQRREQSRALCWAAFWSCFADKALRKSSRNIGSEY